MELLYNPLLNIDYEKGRGSSCTMGMCWIRKRRTWGHVKYSNSGFRVCRAGLVLARSLGTMI